MNRNVCLVIIFEVLYRGYFDRTGDLPSRVDFMNDLKRALPYVRVNRSAA